MSASTVRVDPAPRASPLLALPALCAYRALLPCLPFVADHWQDCGSKDAAPGMHYHDKEGKPIVNKVVFPDLKAMADHAHGIGATRLWPLLLFEVILEMG